MLLQLSKTVKQSPKSPQIFENNGTFCADRPFSKNRSETNCQKSFVFNQLVSERFNRTSFQQQLKLAQGAVPIGPWGRFNRTSFQQQLKLVMSSIFWSTFCSFNRTSFQQQLKPELVGVQISHTSRFNRTSFQQQLKRASTRANSAAIAASIVHPFNNN